MGLAAVTGCATPYGQGRIALARGEWAEAASRFEAALAREPERLDALTGLGVSRYKLGAYGEATQTLTRVVAQAPGDAQARLYLGLSHLQAGETPPAAEQLTAFRELEGHPRLTTQVDRALALLRGDPLLSREARGFVAASLEAEAEWARDLRETQRALYAIPPHWWAYPGPPIVILRNR